MRNLKVLGICLVMGILVVVLNTGIGNADTLYVDDDGPGTYTDINQAIAASTVGDEIVVAPGIYPGVNVTKKLTIRSEKGPEVTKIISSGEYGVYFANNVSGSIISGFFIKGVGNGVYIVNATSLSPKQITVKNNIIENCGKHGILLYALKGNGWNISNIIIENNTIIGNGKSGISFSGDNAYVENCVVSNNIIANNGTYGIRLYRYTQNNAFYNNAISGNADGPTSDVTVTTENGNLFVNPQFVSAETGNYMLLSGSSCIDAGRAGSTYNDPDGSRNNIGVYGGPGAASFWPYPAGGPVITSLSVTPSSVPQGGTITIKATGSVR